MTNEEHIKIVAGILRHLDSCNFTPQDKIAALKSASAIIDNNLTAEMTLQMYANALTKT